MSDMTLADCPVCGRRELRGSSAIHAHHSDRGDVLALSCRSCGATLAAGTNRLLSAPALCAVA
jgi:hypothetical protein